MIWKSAHLYGPTAATPPGAPRLIHRGQAVGAAARFNKLNGKEVSYNLPPHGAAAVSHIGGIANVVTPAEQLIATEKNGAVIRVLRSHSRVEGKSKMIQASTHVNGVELMGDKFNLPNVKVSLESVFADGDKFPTVVLQAAPINLFVRGAQEPIHVTFASKVYTAAAMAEMFTSGVLLVEDHIVENVQLPSGLPKEISFSSPNRLVWEETGIVFLGSVILTPFHRSLTVVDFVFGCGDGGTAAVGDVESVGHTVP